MTMTQNALAKEIVKFAATRSDEAITNPKDGYFHIDVIIDAYEKGYEKGEQSGTTALKEELRGRLFENADKTAQSLNQLLNDFQAHHFTAEAVFIEVNLSCPKILVAFDDAIFHSDLFMDFAYEYVSDLKTQSFDSGLELEVGLVGNLKELNLELLKSDGYTISRNLKTNEAILK